MRRFLIPLALLLGFGPALQAAPQIPLSTDQQRSLGIQTAPVTPTQQSWSISYPAQVVVPNAQLRVVSAPQSGLLETLLAAEGETVQKGQALATLQSPQLLEQQRNYLTALSKLDLAKADWKRDEQLYQEGIIAQRRYLEAQSHYRQAKTEVAQYRQALALIGVDDKALKTLAKQRRLSGSLTIRSPLDGVVLAQLATPGQRLDPLDPIYRIGQLEPLWLEIQVPLENLGDTAVGSRVRVKSPAVTGEVITIGRMVHGVDQGVLVRAEVRDDAALLHPGQFVQAELARSAGAQSYRIPRSALVRHEGATWVFVQKKDGFEPLPVETVAAESDAVVIRGKLDAQDRIATAGTAALKAIWLGGGE